MDCQFNVGEKNILFYTVNYLVHNDEWNICYYEKQGFNADIFFTKIADMYYAKNNYWKFLL